jgi:DNA-binding beta-propeller fold protein YncE
LAQSIPLPAVEGRIDHFAIDLPGQRLFVCALGNNSVEVVDLRRGDRVHSLTGLGNPQGVGYLAASGRLIVANDEGGACKIYDAKSFALVGSVDLKDDADNVRCDAATGQAYVGFGSGGICVIDPQSATRVRSFDLAGHPEAFVLEKNGPRIFVNVPSAHHVAVIDRKQAKVIATWKTGDATANFPIAFDEAGHRLFVGCRSPARLVVLNSDSGALVATVPIPPDPDDVFFDEKKHRLFAICGGGSVAVIDQTNADTYKTAATIPTGPGARTALYVPELDSLFVAVPRHGSQNAEVRRYSVE